MSREAMQQALEALEWNHNTDLDNIPACNQWAKMLKETMEALRAALAEPDRKPLTDEEISSLWDGHTVPVFGKIGINPIVFARAIEAAHGIKENA